MLASFESSIMWSICQCMRMRIFSFYCIDLRVIAIVSKKWRYYTARTDSFLHVFLDKVVDFNVQYAQCALHTACDAHSSNSTLWNDKANNYFMFWNRNSSKYNKESQQVSRVGLLFIFFLFQLKSFVYSKCQKLFNPKYHHLKCQNLCSSRMYQYVCLSSWLPSPLTLYIILSTQ